MREGHWMGISEESPGATLVYYPDTRAVKPERNVYFSKDEAEGVELEGEIIFNKSTPSASSDGPSPTKETLADDPKIEGESDEDEPPQPAQPPSPPATCSRRARKPSQRILDIIAGKGVNSARPSDPKIPVGVQIPDVVEEEETFK